MKKLLNIIWISVLLFSVISCSEDIMDEINRNVNDPTDVTSDLIIPDLMTSTAFSVVGSDLAFYASVYIEHNVGTWAQSYNAEIRTTEPTSASTYNNSWNTIYRNLSNLKIVIDKCSEGGSEEGNYHTLGMAQLLMAYNIAILTDLMGNVPWTEALQPGVIFTPKLDSQESLYVEILTLLNNATTNFGKETLFPSLGSKDFIFAGSIPKWTQFAKGLQARYTMRISKITPDYQKVIDLVNESFASRADEAKYRYDGSAAVSPFYRFFTDRDYFGASNSLSLKLKDRNDPRFDVYFKAHPDASGFEWAPNGAPEQIQGFYGISALSNPTAPTFLLSYHELMFLKAEAHVRLNQQEEGRDALKAAIAASFAKTNVALSDSVAEAYFENEVLGLYNSNPLSEVMNQKYIAFFEEEAIEAYNDIRRLKAMGNDFISLANPLNASQFPLRFTYGSSDVTTNVNIREAYGNGAYVYTENVWWAGGNR